MTPGFVWVIVLVRVHIGKYSKMHFFNEELLSVSMYRADLLGIFKQWIVLLLIFTF